MLSIAPDAIAPVRVPLTTPALGGVLPVEVAELPPDEQAASTRAAAAANAMPAARGRTVSHGGRPNLSPDAGELFFLAMIYPILLRCPIYPPSFQSSIGLKMWSMGG
jgi:hypothetical protein